MPPGFTLVGGIFGVDDPRPSFEPQPLPVGEAEAALNASPTSSGVGRRTVLRVGLVAAVLAAGGFAFAALTSTDSLDGNSRQSLLLAAAQTTLTPERVNMDDPVQVEAARSVLDLPPAAADTVIAESRAKRTSLAWITLWDFLDEDGDVVQLSTGGLTRTVALSHLPTRIAVPIVPGDFLRVTGWHDGAGGGVTVAVASGGITAQVPLAVGQTLTLSVR